MLRGVNSIYNQAAQLRNRTDIADFLFYVRSWAEWVSHHHVLEEERMFPCFEQVIGDPGCLAVNAEQHHVFQPALARLRAYSTDTEPEEYSGDTLRAIVEEIAPGLRQHLSDEIATLMSMRGYDGPALLRVYEECEKEAGKQEKVIYFFV
jgi:hemerythrin-like domain-containing protein